MNHINTPIFQALFESESPRLIVRANSLNLQLWITTVLKSLWQEVKLTLGV